MYRITLIPLLSVWMFLLPPTGATAQIQGSAASLFNGKDLTQWEMADGEPGFEVRDGEIHTTVQNGANIFTKKTYGNFRLSLDYILSEVGNSGIMIRSDPANAWGTGVEVQLLAPWTPYRDDLHCTASLYGHVAVSNRPDETTGIWHHMDIECDRERIRVSVDGKMATEVRIDTVESLNDMYMEGAIGIQSNHSHASEFARFRNLEIVDLDRDPGYVLDGFGHISVRVREQAYQAAVRHKEHIVPGLLKMLDSGDPILEKGSRQVLFDLAAKATGSEASKSESKKLKKLLKKGKQKSGSKMAEDYLEGLIRILK